MKNDKTGLAMTVAHEIAPKNAIDLIGACTYDAHTYGASD